LDPKQLILEVIIIRILYEINIGFLLAYFDGFLAVCTFAVIGSRAAGVGADQTEGTPVKGLG